MDKKIRGKKGIITFNIVHFIPRFVFMIIVLFTVIFLVRSYIVQFVDTADVEKDIVAFRLLYSENGISYYDADTGRLYPGIINSSRFEDKYQDKLDRLIFYGDDNKEIAAKLTLKYTSGKRKMVETIYNKRWYDFWAVPAKLGLPGKGSATQSLKKYKVLVVDKGMAVEDAVPAILEINVVRPES